MAYGSYSEKLHVIPVSLLELLASYLGLETPIIYWSLQYLLLFASPQLASVSRLSSELLQRPGHAGEAREATELHGHVRQLQHDSSKLTPLPGCGQHMLVDNGALVQFLK